MNKNTLDSSNPDRKYGLQTRRGFLFAGVVFLIGCGNQGERLLLCQVLFGRGHETLIV